MSEQNEEVFDLTRMIPLVKVSKEAFLKFVKNYPRPLKQNCFMDWHDYYDFTLDEYPYCCVARQYCGWGGFDYYIASGEKVKE